MKDDGWLIELWIVILYVGGLGQAGIYFEDSLGAERADDPNVVAGVAGDIQVSDPVGD